MMSKKLFALLLAAVMVLSLSACQWHKEVVPDQTAPTNTPEPESLLSSAKQLASLVTLQDDIYSEPVIYSYLYKADTNTLTVYFVEEKSEVIVFFDGGQQVQCRTVYADSGEIYEEFEYDDQGNLIRQITEEGFEVFYVYEDGLCLSKSVYDGQEDPIQVSTWSYDDQGNTVEYRVMEQGTQIHLETWGYEEGYPVKHDLEGTYGEETYCDHETFTYNDQGLVVRSTRQGDDPVDCWDYQVTYTYDQQGRMVEAAYDHADRGSVSDIWEYNDNGDLCRSVSYTYLDGWYCSILEVSFNANGLPVSQTRTEYRDDSDVLDLVEDTYYYYTGDGQLQQVLVMEGDQTISDTQHYYDDQGHCVQSIYNEYGEEVCRYDYEYEGDQLKKVLKNDQVVLEGDIQTGDGLYLPVYMFYKASEEEAQEVAAVNDYILASF